MGYPTYTIAMICYIEAHVKEKKLNYAEMERQIGFSKAHIRDLFQRDTGYPLVQYIRMRKIKRSAFELINTDLSILDIAYRYGFSNPETYTRAFQKVIGMTPSSFREKRPIVGKQELAAGVYSIEILERKEQRSDIVMNKNICKNYESVILYGVPRVGYGCFDGNTPYPMCLKACSEYLGEDFGYDYSMVSSGAAFRMVWNKALTEERIFQVGDNYSVLFEKLLCHLDAITCLTDGRGNAAKFMQELAKIQDEHELYDKASKAFQKVEEAMQEMQALIGSWADAEALECIRKMVK